MTTASDSASQSVLTVDLDAIADNYRDLRARAGAASCAAVIKADSYGLGALRVGPALAAAGCRDFLVAHLNEGLALRPALPAGCAIYVLNGLLPGEEGALIAAGLIPVLNEPGQIELWRTAARGAGRSLPAVLHIDTGMSRLGLTGAETQALLDAPDRLKGIELRYVMSHLACSEIPDHPLNARQLAAFGAWRAKLPGVRASLANSSGVFLGADYAFDLVRPGAALAGINPLPGRPNPMRTTVRLAGKILQIREVDPPQTVGYGATHRVTGRTRIATIATGYADGWPRTLSNRGSAYVGDIRVPVIGRVSMDLTTIDVTAAPSNLHAGDEVELLGPHLSPDDVAETAGTIAYELLTHLGARYQRVYLGGPR